MNDLAEIKKVSVTDLHNFLVQDHTSFTVLSVSTKHIESTNRISVTLSKNSASSFYYQSNQKKTSASVVFQKAYGNLVPQTDDCLTDAENCSYFAFFNSKEKKLYTRFKDKVETNFEGTASNQPLLFLTLTFNTTHTNYSAFTTNWNPEDTCWEPISKKNNWLKNWAVNFDSEAEPCKIKIQKVTSEVSQHEPASYYLSLFFRRIRRLWKPNNWKWTVVSELQKNGIWHFHLLSTPIVPYSHKCTLDKNFTSCWNCRAYISQLWPYGRVESRSPGYKTISNYLAKYLSKSFHLRSLYQAHGLKENHRTYRFFLNLYEYDQRKAIIINGKKLDAVTGQHLPKNQKVFRKFDYEKQETSYFYRTNETLIGKSAKPTLIKKNYRLGTRFLNPYNLVSLANKHQKKEAILLTKKEKLKSLNQDFQPDLLKPGQTFSKDFQEFLVTTLHLLCKTAEFCHLPLEAEQVPKELEHCDNTIQNHFQTKPVLRFTFEPQQASVVRAFINQLDTYAEEFAMEESKDFSDYPPQHSKEHQTIQNLGELCGCETQARNSYLNNWFWNYVNYNTDYQRIPI